MLNTCARLGGTAARAARSVGTTLADFLDDIDQPLTPAEDRRLDIATLSLGAIFLVLNSSLIVAALVLP
jgi:hypothetical protein